MIEVAPEILGLLMLAALVAGFVDSIAGGGGLVTLPALLLAGAPPVTAIATNKIQGLFGAVSAAVAYTRRGLVDPRRQAVPAAIAFGASILGALAVSLLPTDTLRLGLPVLLVAVALFFAFKPGLDDVDRAERMRPVVFNVTAVPLVAAYDGLLGPGAGALYMLALMMLTGRGVLRATAHTKLLNAASNAGGLCAFAIIAEPWWIVGLAMGVAQVVGAQAGARLASERGARLIRPLLVAVTTAMALRMMWDWV